MQQLKQFFYLFNHTSVITEMHLLIIVLDLKGILLFYIKAKKIPETDVSRLRFIQSI